jgi:hypothetical protein
MSLAKEDIITTDKYYNAFPKFYFKIDVITNHSPMNWRGNTIYPPDSNLPIIISGHGDYHIDDELVEFYNPKIWFTVNKQTEKPNVYSLPLGITNDTDESDLHPIYGNLDCMIQVINETIQKKNLVYMNFNINTYQIERQHVWDLFYHIPWVTIGSIENTLNGRRQFLREIKSHDFVLCPRGNGLDTHRLWETLYMESIPIVKRDIGVLEFEDLPICFIDSWEEVNPEFLEKEKERIQNKSWNLEKLKISYWINKIQNYL